MVNGTLVNFGKGYHGNLQIDFANIKNQNYLVYTLIFLCCASKFGPSVLELCHKYNLLGNQTLANLLCSLYCLVSRRVVKMTAECICVDIFLTYTQECIHTRSNFQYTAWLVARNNHHEL